MNIIQSIKKDEPIPNKLPIFIVWKSYCWAQSLMKTWGWARKGQKVLLTPENKNIDWANWNIKQRLMYEK
jgi:hypothetical protein